MNGVTIFGTGIAVAGAFNCWLWRSDCARALRLKTRTAMPVYLQATPRVTILVAAWNEAGIIAEHVWSVSTLRYPNKEYVLCAGGPDGTFAIAYRTAAEWMTVLRQEAGEGMQGALCRALSRATGDIIFLTDADCLLTDNAFERTLAPLINEGEAVACGTSEPLPTQKGDPFVLDRWFKEIYVQAREGSYVGGLRSVNAALTRQALRAGGDLQAHVTSGIDYYLSKQVLGRGYRIRFVRDSIVPTEYEGSVLAFGQRQSRWLWNVIVHGWYFRAYREVASCVLTSVIGLAMLVGGAIAVWQGGAVLAGWSVIYLHVLASRIRYMRFGELMSGLRFPAYYRLPVTILFDFGIWSLAVLRHLVPRVRREG